MTEGRPTQFLEEVGLHDIWRTWNPDGQQYSCFSSSYSTLSRIDMALGNGEALQLVKNKMSKRGVGSLTIGADSE